MKYLIFNKKKLIKKKLIKKMSDVSFDKKIIV